MTAIVGVINAQGIAIAADSAVTVSGSKGTKVYNKANKLFTLSKYHPVGIAIYGGANFMGIPLETLIKTYRNRLGENNFDTLEDFKLDFISYVKENIVHVGEAYKISSFYSFCLYNYNVLSKKLKEILVIAQDAIAGLEENQDVVLNAIFEQCINEYVELIDSYPKSEIINNSFEDFVQFYQLQLNNIVTELNGVIAEVFGGYIFTNIAVKHIYKVFHLVGGLANIFESSTGLVFVGFGANELYPSSQLVTLGGLIMNNVRYKVEEPIKIIPGEKDSNIIPYVQGDVAVTVLTGIDPTYQNTINTSITTAFDAISEEILAKLEGNENAVLISEVIKETSTTLVRSLDDHKFDSITKPLLDILTSMGKEDMAELAESLVNITSLKRKFTLADSSEESVGGPVDVAVITKGDGFIWMKRKHYFDIEINKGFLNKYYN